MRLVGQRTALSGLVGALLALSAAPAALAQTAAPVAALSAGDLERLRAAVEAPSAREAIARVAYAEAAGQGDSGLAGVVYTILNRVASGGWGASVGQVVNARGQFEPVMRIGGDWRGLAQATPSQRARIDTILNLALDGRLPDLTGGALYFQNPRIVAARAQAGLVTPALVHFGGSAPSAVIGDHAFYAQVRGTPTRPPVVGEAASGRQIIIAAQAPDASATAAPPPDARGLFVLPDGSVVQELARPR
jgi:N-acetylmuramoyl-L-alanine amidase